MNNFNLFVYRVKLCLKLEKDANNIKLHKTDQMSE